MSQRFGDDIMFVLTLLVVLVVAITIVRGAPLESWMLMAGGGCVGYWFRWSVEDWNG